MRVVGNMLSALTTGTVKLASALRPFLPKHGFKMVSNSKHCFVVNFSVPPQILAQQLPRGLQPDVCAQNGRAFIRVMIEDVQGVRPVGFVEELGLGYTRVSYQAIVKSPTGDRGSYVLHSNVDSTPMSIASIAFSNFRSKAAAVCWGGMDRLPPHSTFLNNNPLQHNPTDGPTASDSNNNNHTNDQNLMHFSLAPKHTHGIPSLESKESPAAAVVQCSFDVKNLSHAMPGHSAFAGKSVSEASEYLCDVNTIFDARPERDFWSAVKVSTTHRPQFVRLNAVHSDFEFMKSGKFGADVQLDSAFYARDVERHWQKLTTHRYRLPDTAEDRNNVVMFHDGGCPLCTIEVGHLKRLAAADPNSNVKFEDVTASGGDDNGTLSKYFGLSRTDALSRIYILDHGVLRSGIAGFVALWHQLPYWRYLAKLFGSPFSIEIAEMAYGVFLKVRLPLANLMGGRTDTQSKSQSALGPGASCRANQEI